LGAVNDQVRMGEPLGRLRGLRQVRLGQIYDLGQVPAIQINQTEAVGLIAGGGLLLGSAFAKGPAATLMAVLGAAGIGFAAYNILNDLIARLPIGGGPAPAPAYPGTPGSLPGQAAGFAAPATGYAPQAATPMLLPPPIAKPTRTQTALQITSAAAPAAIELVKGLVSLF
jgi:hypothetical protein